MRRTAQIRSPSRCASASRFRTTTRSLRRARNRLPAHRTSCTFHLEQALGCCGLRQTFVPTKQVHTTCERAVGLAAPQGLCRQMNASSDDEQAVSTIIAGPPDGCGSHPAQRAWYEDWQRRRHAGVVATGGAREPAGSGRSARGARRSTMWPPESVFQRQPGRLRRTSNRLFAGGFYVARADRQAELSRRRIPHVLAVILKVGDGFMHRGDCRRCARTPF